MCYLWQLILHLFHTFGGGFWVWIIYHLGLQFFHTMGGLTTFSYRWGWGGVTTFPYLLGVGLHFFHTFGRWEVHSNGQGTLMVLHNPLLPNVTPMVLSLTWGHQNL